MAKEIKTPLKKSVKLTSEQKQEKFWDEVDQLAQDKIYQILTNNIPFQNSKQITENYTYEDRQHKLTGLFLNRDVDYRTICADLESQYSYEEALPNSEYLAEEITLLYCQMVIKAIINSLSTYDCYDPSHFENLAEN